MSPRAPLALAAASVAAAVLQVVPASGQDPLPTPGCAGIAFSDKAGDQVFAVPGLGGTGEGAPNTDVLRGWFTTGDDGTFANIEVSKLDETVQSPSTATGWYMVWTLGEETKFVKAETTGDGFTYSYGTLDAGFTEEGETAGKAFPGDKGILRIKIPAVAGGSLGKKLSSPYAHTTNSYSVPGVGGALGTADDGPDGQNGTAYTVAGCAEPTTPAPAATPTPAPGATPAPTGPSGPPAAAPGLGLSIKPGFASVKTIVKKRKVTLRLAAKAPLTAVVVSLTTTKGKVVATGRLAKIGRTATATLKLKGTPKPGTYRLNVTAKTASGQTVSGRYRFKLKK